jgi:hypothetical protein
MDHSPANEMHGIARSSQARIAQRPLADLMSRMHHGTPRVLHQSFTSSPELKGSHILKIYKEAVTGL